MAKRRRKAREPDLTVQDVAEVLQVSEQTVTRRIRTGQLEAYVVGRQYRVEASALERFKRERKVVTDG